MSDQQTVHIRKDGSNTYTLSRWIKGFRAEVMSLRRTNGRLLLIDAEDGVRGGVYYFPESDSMLIEAIGLCTSIEKCTEEGA